MCMAVRPLTSEAPEDGYSCQRLPPLSWKRPRAAAIIRHGSARARNRVECGRTDARRAITPHGPRPHLGQLSPAQRPAPGAPHLGHHDRGRGPSDVSSSQSHSVPDRAEPHRSPPPVPGTSYCTKRASCTTARALPVSSRRASQDGCAPPQSPSQWSIRTLSSTHHHTHTQKV